MGWITGAIIYKLGKRRGRKTAERRIPQPVGPKPTKANCENYWRFCRGYGSCDGLVCEEFSE